jgi:DNA-binding CsgD family transcriptional regulator
MATKLPETSNPGHTAKHMSLAALRSIDRKTAEAVDKFILLDRQLRLNSAPAGGETLAFMPFVLTALSDYTQANLPEIIELGDGCSLYTVKLTGKPPGPAMLVFVRSTILSAALRHAQEIYALTAREAVVLSLVSEAYTNKEIAAKLIIAESTASDYIQSLFRKMCCIRRTQLMRKLLLY